jgi:hypothetical protein
MFFQAMEESVWTPFHKSCSNDVAYGNAYHMPASGRTCALTQVSQGFASMSMNACDATTQAGLELYESGCAAQGGTFCTTAAVVSGQMSPTAFGTPQFTYIKMGCIPTCIPSDCSVEDNEEAVLSFVTRDTILQLLQDQDFQVQQLDAIVPYVQCFGNGPDTLPTEVFTSLVDTSNSRFYQIGSAFIVAMAVLLIVAYLVFAIWPLLTKSASADEQVHNDEEEPSIRVHEVAHKEQELADLAFNCDKDKEGKDTCSMKSNSTIGNEVFH